MLAETSSAAAGITATVEAAAMCSSLSVESTAATSVAAVAIISGAASTFDISVLPREELEPYPRALSAPVHEHDTAPNTVDKVADLIHLRQGPQAGLLGGYGSHFYVQLQHHPQDFRWPTNSREATSTAGPRYRKRSWAHHGDRLPRWRRLSESERPFHHTVGIPTMDRWCPVFGTCFARADSAHSSAGGRCGRWRPRARVHQSVFRSSAVLTRLASTARRRCTGDGRAIPPTLPHRGILRLRRGTPFAASTAFHERRTDRED
jgi:hypothetical protein